MPEPIPYDKDDFTSLPPGKESGFRKMADKLQKALAGEDISDSGGEQGGQNAPGPEDGGGEAATTKAPEKTAAPAAPEPAKEGAKPAPAPAGTTLKTVSGLKTEPPKPNEDTPNFEVGDDEVPATIKSAKAADDFKKIKRSLKETQHRLGLAEKVLKDRESEVATLKSAPKPTGPTQEEYEAAVKERAELQSRLETVALERSPAFQARYKTAFDSAINRAKAAVGDANAAQIEQLMTLPPSKYRNQQIETIREQIETGVDKGQLDLAVAQMDSARDEMNGALAKSRETYNSLAEEEKRKSEAQKQALANRIQSMERKALELAQQSSAFELNDSDPDHNKEVDARINSVKKFLRGEATEDDIVQAAVLAQENLFLTGKYIPRLLQALTTMESELKAIKGSGPTTAGSTATTTSKAATKGRTFSERFLEEYQEPAS